MSKRKEEELTRIIYTFSAKEVMGLVTEEGRRHMLMDHTKPTDPAIKLHLPDGGVELVYEYHLSKDDKPEETP